MKVTHALIALLALPLAARAQVSAPSAADVVDRIVDEALASGEAYGKLRALCTVAPHRLSGSEGAEAAVAWARAAMIADGLENVRLEPCTVPRWERGAVEELSLVVEGGEDLSLPVLALGGSIATPEEGIEAGLVVVETFEELAELGEAARGKVVLFNRPMDDRLVNTFRAYGGAVGQRGGGAIEAARVGAVAALVRSMTTRRDDVPHTGAMRYREGVERIPAAAVSTNGADDLARRVAAGEDVRVRLRLDCRWLEPVTSYNVVGELVGRERPEEVIVVGGHLDAWDVGEGAHDDGAGCVQSMEALRLLKALDLRPRRTLRCVLFMNEENGLGGGRTYHRDHLEEMDRHVLAIESDRGGFTPRGFSVQGSPEALAELRALAPLLERTGATRIEAGGGGADIGPMSASGVPLVGFVPDPQRYFDVHHSPNDVFEAVNPRELHLGTAAIAALAWLVAEREEALPRVRVEPQPPAASDRE
jgi:Zn-dependent M28 family amino/carboxypeptidase